MLFCASGAWALDQQKAAGNIARQASAAFEQGDHARAAQLYLQAFATDPATADYLYGAARAEHIGGKLGVAEQHYVAFLAKVTSGPRADNARKYLSELRSGQAEQKIADAEKAERQGSFALAAQLYRLARTLVPTRWECLFREALAREQNGDKSEAAALLEQYLRDAPKDARDRDEASVRLAALKPKTAQLADKVPVMTHKTEPGKVMAPDLQVGQPAPLSDRSTQQIIAWTVAFVGVATGATGIEQAIDAAGKRSDLDAKLALHSGKVTDISYSEAVTRDKAIQSQRTTAAILGGVGVAVAGTGGWLLWRAYKEPPKLSALPLGNGVVVTLRF